MLRLFIDSVPEGLTVIKDVEEYFDTIQLDGSTEEKKFIECIEKGTFNDKDSFIDRFGFKLYLSELSTGCKAALCTLHCKDNKVISLRECGLNARDAIVTLSSNGSVLVVDNGITFSTEYGNDIDVLLDTYHFTDMNRLNFYIFDELRLHPDLSYGGIELC